MFSLTSEIELLTRGKLQVKVIICKDTLFYEMFNYEGVFRIFIAVC